MEEAPNPNKTDRCRSVYTRIVLHGGTSQQYDVLHGLMQRGGFANHITDPRFDFAFELPRAEYVSEHASAHAAWLAASTFADSVTRKNAVVSAETSLIIWTGLERLPEAND